MAYTTFRSVISGIDIPISGAAVTGETHTIPVTAPYSVKLDRLPKINSAATSYLSNTYVSVADMASAGISLTIGGSSATLTSSPSPSVGECYFQIIDSDYPFSTKLVFNSADKGKAVVVNYTGYMSTTDADFVTAIQDAITRLETYAPLAVLSASTYDGGAFGNGTIDGTTVYALPATGKLAFTDDDYVWAGATIDLTTGDTEVSAFTDVDGYKQIGLYVVLDAGVLAPVITEGAEATTPGNVTAQDPPDVEYYHLADIVVQGDGTGAAGGIEAVAQADITWRGTVGQSSAVAKSPMTALLFKTWGTPDVGTELDGAVALSQTFVIDHIDVLCADTGTSGSDLVLDVKSGSGAGTSLFDNASDKPTIAANSGTYQVDITPAADMNSERTITAPGIVRVIVDSAPTGGETVTCTLWGYFL